MKIGIIGVGPWGLRLAEACETLGFPVTDYARKPGSPDQEGLGKRWNHWRDMMSKVDGIICAATPAVTYEVYRESIALKKAVLLTKPLYVNELPDETISAPILIDYVRLWSPCYEEIKRRVRGFKISSIKVSFCGDGPVRSFPGLYDYGPHAFAWIFDLLESQVPTGCKFEISSLQVVKQAHPGKKLYIVQGSLGDVVISVTTGNGLVERGKNKSRNMTVHYAGQTPLSALYTESADEIRAEFCGTGKDDVTKIPNDRKPGLMNPVSRMVKAFIDGSGFGLRSKPLIGLKTLSLSVKIHQTLKTIASYGEDE